MTIIPKVQSDTTQILVSRSMPSGSIAMPKSLLQWEQHMSLLIRCVTQALDDSLEETSQEHYFRWDLLWVHAGWHLSIWLTAFEGVLVLVYANCFWAASDSGTGRFHHCCYSISCLQNCSRITFWLWRLLFCHADCTIILITAQLHSNVSLQHPVQHMLWRGMMWKWQQNNSSACAKMTIQVPDWQP